MWVVWIRPDRKAELFMKSILFDINCGEKTCASEPGKFCKWVRTRKFGAIYFCHLWHAEDIHGKQQSLEEKDGWLMRRPECLNAEEAYNFMVTQRH